MCDEILQENSRRSNCQQGSFETPKTIRSILDMVASNQLVLPAIQRDYVWDADQVVRLFDSLMKGYPISSFLFWNVDAEAVGDYKFYRFLREYKQELQTHGKEFGPFENRRSCMAVLDGQQRITSLFIGFCGSFAWRISGKWRSNLTEEARPTRRLYLNLSGTLNESDEEDARVYQFEFKTQGESNDWKDLYEAPNGTYWFRVGKIYDFSTTSLFEYFFNHDFLKQSQLARMLLTRLLDVLNADKVINYYLVDDDNLQKALNIFIRINSGGTKLGISAIILSIAISYWKGDAKQAFEDLIFAVGNEEEFRIDHDFILKTFLVLHNQDIRFKASNFKKQTAQTLEDCWSDLSKSIKVAFELISDFGYCEGALLSLNSIIPIIYYIYKKKIWDDIMTKVGFAQDRKAMERWLHIVNVSKAFGYSGDAMLMRCRKALNHSLEIGGGFPARAIIKEMGVSFSEESIEELLGLQKHDKRTFPVLALLYPDLKFRYHSFHKDHMHASAAIASYREKTILVDEDKEYYENSMWWNSLRNLQLLDANENQSKQDISLKDWIENEIREKGCPREQLLQRCYIPANVDLDISNLKQFLLARGELLRAVLKEKLTFPEE